MQEVFKSIRYLTLFFRNHESDGLFMAVDYVSAILNGWFPGRPSGNYSNRFGLGSVSRIVFGTNITDSSGFRYRKGNYHRVTSGRCTIVIRYITIQVSFEEARPGGCTSGKLGRNLYYGKYFIVVFLYFRCFYHTGTFFNGRGY